MNCKQGDLALAIPPSFDAGKVFTCVEVLMAPTPETLAVGINAGKNYPLWRVDRRATWIGAWSDNHMSMPFIPDRSLLPLRPPASDETDTADQDLPAECGA